MANFIAPNFSEFSKTKTQNKKIMGNWFVKKLHLPTAVLTVAFLFALLLAGTATYVYANDTSNFTQTINPGTLSIDIVDDSFVTVGSPSVGMGDVDFSFSCQTATGTFGSNTERIYVENPDAADSGWSATLGATATTDVWDSAGTDYDFNDPTGAGCTDGGDTDSVGGQMTVDASGGSLNTGQCSGCGTSNITLGSSDAFEEGVTNSITLITAAAGSDDIGDWYLTGVGISQEVPAEQPAASDYDINMMLSVATL